MLLTQVARRPAVSGQHYPRGSPEPPFKRVPTALRADRPKEGDHLARGRPRPGRNPCRDRPAGSARPRYEGYPSLEQLTQVTAAELGRLHGVGPKALRLFGEALAERGLSFANEEPQHS